MENENIERVDDLYINFKSEEIKVNSTQYIIYNDCISVKDKIDIYTEASKLDNNYSRRHNIILKDSKKALNRYLSTIEYPEELNSENQNNFMNYVLSIKYNPELEEKIKQVKDEEPIIKMHTTERYKGTIPECKRFWKGINKSQIGYVESFNRVIPNKSLKIRYDYIVQTSKYSQKYKIALDNIFDYYYSCNNRDLLKYRLFDNKTHEKIEEFAKLSGKTYEEQLSELDPLSITRPLSLDRIERELT